MRIYQRHTNSSTLIVRLGEVGKTRDGRTSVTVEMGKTRDGTFRDRYVTNQRAIIRERQIKFSLKTLVLAEICDDLAITRDGWGLNSL